jgi:hypothetical protein
MELIQRKMLLQQHNAASLYSSIKKKDQILDFKGLDCKIEKAKMSEMGDIENE